MNAKTIQKALGMERVELLRAGNASVEAFTGNASSDVLVLYTKDGGTVHVWHEAQAEKSPYHRLRARVISMAVEVGEIQDR